jgi:phosphoribosylglycinamide formyltransferase-1
MKNHRIRLGIIGSSGGSALIAADSCLKVSGFEIEWIVITDRDCGLEQWARENDHLLYRLNYANAKDFSKLAFTIFDMNKCQNILMFFTRKVTAPLIDNLHVWNIHPSLLPSFAGLHGIEDSLKAKVTIFGATLHRVDDGLDTGEIQAQVAAPMRNYQDLERIKRLSYFQKIWLTLFWVARVKNLDDRSYQIRCDPAISVAWPGLTDLLYQAYKDWVANEESMIE